ncbi:sacsin N-terminal ATP-binding-like domain-containing protein [Synechococcus sp. PCC 7336]|uniref:sacsin N-terminal ATP-binding-like domain-containing protein n=1 Tax=Synechococcus sp. PCC 7336 TaxID=195250 RepID=UPI000348ABD9|nr:hypothetical protein [Synechococcus sp. PCC 7336]
MIQSIEKGRKDAGDRSIAEKIVKRLHDLEKTVENNLGRWAWELLQNAKDSIADEDERTLHIQIELNQNSIEFKHDGTHFTEQDVIGLISQISSKEVEEEAQTKKTGRFGTGFLTTHLLSRVIKVRGVLRAEDKSLYRFNFLLDRRGNTTSQLLPRIEKSWNDFRDSVEKVTHDFEENQLNTSFCYYLETDRQKEIAKMGIKQFSDLIPFVLAFIPKIAKVKIIDRVSKCETFFTNDNDKKDYPVLHILKTENDKTTDLFILHASNGGVSIATEIEKIEKGFLIKEIANVPKLFCDFPLIGTENFHFPMIVNSFFFNPLTERDGIWLKGNDDIEVKENQKILHDAVELYKQQVALVAGGNFFNLYNLVETKMPSTDRRYFDDKWYENYIQKPLRKFILDAEIVELEAFENAKGSISELDFPNKSFSEIVREKIWQFIFDLSPNTVCKKNHLQSWCSLSWDGWSLVNYKDIINAITGRKNIDKLCKDLGKSEVEAFKWLNTLGEFILEDSNNYYLFERSLIVPNKNRIFRTQKSLFIDEINDDDIIQVLRLLGEDWNDILRHDLVEFGDYAAKGKKDIAAAITEKLKNPDSTDNTVEAINLLSGWFENNSNLGAKLFTELYSKRAELFMNTIEDKESLYRVMRSCKDLSQLAEVVESIEDKSDISENIQKVEELEKLLQEFNISNVSELKDILVSAQESSDNRKIKITEEVLLSLGVTSIEELEEALKDRNIAEQFTHISTPSALMFMHVQNLIGRAKNNVLEYLQNLSEYDCSDWEELATTVIGGIKKDGLPVYIVVRPSDSGEVIIYYSSEKDTLDEPSAELWIDDGVQDPKCLTLGKILKNTGITRIPV